MTADAQAPTRSAQLNPSASFDEDLSGSRVKWFGSRTSVAAKIR